MLDDRLRMVAYGVLGSMADAEDVVQEARLKLHQSKSAVRSEEAFLYRVVSNLSIDRYRYEKRRRHLYDGPWLPEPISSEDMDKVELAQELSIGLLHVLEHLSPSERIVFVLREAFGWTHTEVAETLGISPASARQRASRAKHRLASTDYRPRLPSSEERVLLDSLMAVVAEGDAAGLISMMTDDVVMYTDGGGVVSAAIRPVYEAERISTVTLFLVQKSEAEGELDWSYESINGSTALVVRQFGKIHSVIFVTGEAGLVSRFYIMRNPHKLTRL